MKMLKVVLIVLLFCLYAVLAQATEKGDVSIGAKLFVDPHFAGSTNSKSCSSCHEEGDLQKAGSRENLADIINNCIAYPLAGKPLAKESQEMLDMQAYIKSLANKVAQ